MKNIVHIARDVRGRMGQHHQEDHDMPVATAWELFALEIDRVTTRVRPWMERTFGE